MFVNLSIMKPNAGHEQDTIDSMHRFGEAARNQPGLMFVTTQREKESGDLIGIAVWDFAESARAASGALQAAVADDDFETWVASMQNFDLSEV